MQQNDRDAADAFLFERFLHEARCRRQVVSHACSDERSQLRSANLQFGEYVRFLKRIISQNA
jgi:hypothetical protein